MLLYQILCLLAVSLIILSYSAKPHEESISFCVVRINFDSSPGITHIFGVIEFYKRAEVMNFA